MVSRPTVSSFAPSRVYARSGDGRCSVVREDHELRAALQKLRDAKWPYARPRKQSTPPGLLSGPAACCSCSHLPQSLLFLFSLLCFRLQHLLLFSVLRPLLQHPSLPYDVTQCSRLSVRQNFQQTSRASLAKHVSHKDVARGCQSRMVCCLSTVVLAQTGPSLQRTSRCRSCCRCCGGRVSKQRR